jgi:hypothetical protein
VAVDAKEAVPGQPLREGGHAPFGHPEAAAVGVEPDVAPIRLGVTNLVGGNEHHPVPR